MNKKIFAILTLLIVAASIGAVSAFDLADLFNSEPQNQTVEINGVDFNIPAGFEENNTGFNNLEKNLTDLGLNITGRGYVNNNTYVALVVANYDNFNLTQDEVLDSIGGNATAINGVKGFISTDDEGDYLFTYPKNDDVVFISSSDKDIIGDFIIA